MKFAIAMFSTTCRFANCCVKIAKYFRKQIYCEMYIQVIECHCVCYNPNKVN